MVDAVVVGAGFAGLYLLHHLREIGCTAVALESAAKPFDAWDVRGLWHRQASAGHDEKAAGDVVGVAGAHRPRLGVVTPLRAPWTTRTAGIPTASFATRWSRRPPAESAFLPSAFCLLPCLQVAGFPATCSFIGSPWPARRRRGATACRCLRWRRPRCRRRASSAARRARCWCPPGCRPR